MTKRVLLLGNSHVAALRDALTRFENLWPGMDVACVGAHKDALLETVCENGRLIPISEDAIESFRSFGGVDAIDLSAFDAIVVVGCQIACSRASFLYRRSRWLSLPSMTNRKTLISDEWTLLSEAAYTAMLFETLSQTLGGKLLAHLRSGTDVPLFLASQPRTATGIMTRDKHALSVLNDITRYGDAPTISAMFDRTANAVCKAHGATFLMQPRQTIQNHVLTKPVFTKGAVRLSRDGRYPQPNDDILHANASYGATVLDQIAAKLGVDKALADVEE